MAGGLETDDGLYRDTHGHQLAPAVLGLLEDLAARAEVPGAMLERDDHFPPDSELNAELDAIARAIESGTARRLAAKNIAGDAPRS